MSELGFERRVQATHTELTPGHDVTHLLSNINQNYKQSKADQILRLLHDQDKVQDGVEELEDIDAEYNKIREEKVICDSDTLTDSSSDHESDVTLAEKEEVVNESEKIMISNQNNPKSKEGRCKTSIGFYGFERNDSGIHLDHEGDGMTDKMFDTRDLSIRPKSSYVRRGHLYRKNTEIDMDTSPSSTNDVTDSVTHRAMSAKNRPKSRLGRESVNRRERKIEMHEATPVVPTEIPVKEDNEVKTTGATAGVYRRFERTRTPLPRKGSKRTKGFCEDNINNTASSPGHVPADTVMHSPRNVYPVYSDMDTNVNDVTISMVPNASTVTRTPVQSISNTATVPRHTPAPTNQHRHLPSQPARAETFNRHHREGSHVADPHTQNTHYVNTRSDTVLTAASSVRPENVNVTETETLPVKFTPSNLHSSFNRPKNPEPITTRPIGRADIRPGTRQRRLTRRYMQQTSNPMNAVRPTSESVILARQKTEKSLLKKQADNRPHSEKIPPTNKMLSVSNNPTQGPQTNIMSKEGMTQSSHVGSSGFRGYDPGSRMKSSSRSRDVPADLTLPRSGQNNVMYGSRKSLAALMKLPPLEASLAAKKKERGLTLAQRETCV